VVRVLRLPAQSLILILGCGARRWLVQTSRNTQHSLWFPSHVRTPPLTSAIHRPPPAKALYAAGDLRSSRPLLFAGARSSTISSPTPTSCSSGLRAIIKDALCRSRKLSVLCEGAPNGDLAGATFQKLFYTRPRGFYLHRISYIRSVFGIHAARQLHRPGVLLNTASPLSKIAYGPRPLATILISARHFSPPVFGQPSVAPRRRIMT